MRIYSIQIGNRTFQVKSTNAAQACKMAIRAWQAGREEPKELSLTVKAAEIPAVTEIGFRDPAPVRVA